MSVEPPGAEGVCQLTAAGEWYLGATAPMNETLLLLLHFFFLRQGLAVWLRRALNFPHVVKAGVVVSMVLPSRLGAGITGSDHHNWFMNTPL